MVSYGVYYSHIHRDFSDWYQTWWVKNCEHCPFSSHHNPNLDTGHCQAEYKLRMLSKKVRVQQYIAIDYHKHEKGMVCLLKQGVTH